MKILSSKLKKEKTNLDPKSPQGVVHTLSRN